MTEPFKKPASSFKLFKILSMSLSHPCHFTSPWLVTPRAVGCDTPRYRCRLARVGWHNSTARRHQLQPLTKNIILIQCKRRAKRWGGDWEFFFFVTVVVVV